MLQEFGTYNFEAVGLVLPTSGAKILGYITAPANLHAFLQSLEVSAYAVASDDAFAIGFGLAANTPGGGDDVVLSPVNPQHAVFTSGLSGVFKFDLGTAITTIALSGGPLAVARGNKMDVPGWDAKHEGGFPKIAAGARGVFYLLKNPTVQITGVTISGTIALI